MLGYSFLYFYIIYYNLFYKRINKLLLIKWHNLVIRAINKPRNLFINSLKLNSLYIATFIKEMDFLYISLGIIKNIRIIKLDFISGEISIIEIYKLINKL